MIKNILFDFGGVLFDLDFNISIEAFEKLGFVNVQSMFSQYHVDDLFKNLETGKITPEEFYKALIRICPQPVEEHQISDAWNAMLLGFRYDSLNYLISLKEKYNLYLLSNTNQIHYDYFTAQLQQDSVYTSLDAFFTKPYYSHEIGLRKPDKETFEFVMKDAGIKAAETLFIDDTFSNFPNAEALGLKTHLMLPSERVEFLDYESY